MIKRIFSWLTGAAFGLALLLPQAAFAQTAAKPFSNEQLEQMTAPVALYPESLLAQLFMATTYPDDFAAAAAWSKSHPNDKGDAAVKLVENQPWDPSVASLVAFPEVLITFGDKPEMGHGLVGIRERTLMRLDKRVDIRIDLGNEIFHAEASKVLKAGHRLR